MGAEQAFCVERRVEVSVPEDAFTVEYIEIAMSKVKNGMLRP